MPGSGNKKKEFHDYVVDSLQRVGDISTKKMMGEYCIYNKSKIIGDICDNTLLLKPTESVLRLMPDAKRASMYEELPEPKKKVKKNKRRTMDGTGR
ncbi:MAG TPA: competence protein TfoX [Lachnospiraceae bacterium]|nr:competence protein TfoX [Lachnospiraceae bacterium]